MKTTIDTTDAQNTISCRGCKKPYPADHYVVKLTGRRNTRCADCAKHARDHFHRSNERAGRKYYRMATERQRDHRRYVLQRYGGVCVCCGESDLRFLTLDHVNSDGAAHRREMKRTGAHATVEWAIRHDCPPTLQVLCYNCNCGRHSNGGICPHVSEEKPYTEIAVRRTRKPHITKKMTEDDVRDIRRRHADGETMTALAKDYAVNLQNVWHIVHRRSWKNVA